jgi:hypothetical protein
VEPTFSDIFLYQIVQVRLVNRQFPAAKGGDLGFVVIGASDVVSYFRKASACNQANIPTANHRNSQDSDLRSKICIPRKAQNPPGFFVRSNSEAAL